MANRIITTSTFESLYMKKKKTHPRYIIDRINGAILDLMNSDDPKSLGERKRGRLSDCYAYDLNSESRLLYSVRKEDNHTAVILLRVCNHKKVYGSG